MDKQCKKCGNGCLLDQTKQLVKSFEEQKSSSEKSEAEKEDLQTQIIFLQVVIKSQEASHENLVAKNQNDKNQKQPEKLSNGLQKTVASSETNDELKKSINEKKAVKNSHEQQSKDQIKQVAGTEKNPLKVSQTEEVKVDKQMNFVSIMDTLPEQTKEIMKSVLESIKFDVSWTAEVEEKVLQKIKRIDEQFDLYGPFRKLIPRYEGKREIVKSSGIQQIYVKQNINIPLFSYWLETLGINLNMLDISHDQDEDKMLTVELFENNGQHHSSITGLESLFDKKEMNKFIAILNKNYCKRAKAYPKKNEPVTVKTFEIKDNFFVGLVQEAAQLKNIKPTQIVFTVDYLCSLKPGELKQYLKPKPVEQPKSAPDVKQQKNTQTQPNNVVLNPQSSVQDQRQTRSAAAEGIHTQNFKSTNEIQKPIRVQTNEKAISTIFGIPTISSQKLLILKQKFSLSEITYHVSDLALEVGKVNRATIDTILTFLKIEFNSVQFLDQAEPFQPEFKTTSVPFQIVKNYRKPYLPKVYCKFLLQPQVWILDLEKFDWRLQDAIETIKMAGLLVNCTARVERLKWFEFICIKGDGLTPYYIEDVLRSLGIGQNQRRFEGANNQRYTVRVTKTVKQVIPTKVDQSFNDYYDDEDDEEAQRWGEWARIKGTR